MAFSGLGRALCRSVGVDPARCAVQVTDTELQVRMGWMLSLTAPLADVASAAPVEHRWWWGMSPHLIGWHSWVANGSTEGRVEARFRRIVPARVSGVADAGCSPRGVRRGPRGTLLTRR